MHSIEIAMSMQGSDPCQRCKHRRDEHVEEMGLFFQGVRCSGRTHYDDRVTADCDCVEFIEADTPHFDGHTYVPDRDHERLSGQLGRVKDLMKDGRWRTLDEIRYECGGTVASVSARLRDLRKDKFGSYDVERQYIENGLFQYRVRGIVGDKK